MVIEKSWGAPTVTKDGVTVAKEIQLEDKFENMGAQMVKEVASKTSDVAGDGTTTATVLARAIFSEGCRMVAAGHDPMTLKRGVEKAVVAIVEELKRLSKPTKDPKEIAQVGTISANNDSDDRRHHRRGDGQGRQGRRDHGRGSEEPRDASSRSSRACSSTAAIFRPTSSPIPTAWRPSLEDAADPDPREEDQLR